MRPVFQEYFCFFQKHHEENVPFSYRNLKKQTANAALQTHPSPAPVRYWPGKRSNFQRITSASVQKKEKKPIQTILTVNSSACTEKNLW